MVHEMNCKHELRTSSGSLIPLEVEERQHFNDGSVELRFPEPILGNINSEGGDRTSSVEPSPRREVNGGSYVSRSRRTRYGP